MPWSRERPVSHMPAISAGFISRAAPAPTDDMSMVTESVKQCLTVSQSRASVAIKRRLITSMMSRRSDADMISVLIWMTSASYRLAAQCLQRAAPRVQLIEECGERFLVARMRFERLVILPVGGEH